MQGYLNLKKLITMKRLFLLLVAGLLASAATMQVGAQAPRHHGWEYYPLKGNVKSVVVYEVWDEESDPEPYATFEFCENGDVMAYYPEMLGDSSDYHSYKYNVVNSFQQFQIFSFFDYYQKNFQFLQNLQLLHLIKTLIF